MDIADVMAGSCVQQAPAEPSVETTLPERPVRAADDFPGTPYQAHEIISAIIDHHPVPSTLQMVADTLVTLCPSRGVAIFLLSGPQLRIEAEAGLPKRHPGGLPQLTARTPPVLDSADGREDPGSLPALAQILASGLKLCMALPLISGSGEARGAFTVFDRQQEPLDPKTRDTIQGLCDLARMAIEHGRLHDEVVHGLQFDRLTGLPNRTLLADRLGQAMIVAKRQGELLAVCCIDLDRFKQFNDILGYELGDAFFKQISERLNRSIRKIDTLARQEGDAFILGLFDLTDVSNAAGICHRLLKELSQPFLIDGHSLTITASIGISIFPDHGDSADQLLSNADMALQEAKRAGGGEARIYSLALGRQTRRAAEMVGALVTALTQAQFRIAYQPIFGMDGEIFAFEALLRWKHPTWGHVSPLEFIPSAERSGLIVAIGDWVIDEVCRQAMAWSAHDVHPVKMFANVSGVQLARPDFGLKIADALSRTGLAPDRLELEITESWVIADLRAAARNLQKLRDLGIGIALDDFGTGYAAFNYLQELPLDTLKIDRSFVQGLDGSSGHLATVRAIATLARQMGLKTVAEGVESEQQLRQLCEMGCEFMQGFFLARPLKPEAAYALLRKRQHSPTNCLV